MEANREEVSDEDETEWYLRRVDAGLSSLQNADYVLAWVCMEDDGAMMHARTLLDRKNQTFGDVIEVLEGTSAHHAAAITTTVGVGVALTRCRTERECWRRRGGAECAEDDIGAAHRVPRWVVGMSVR
jgi:hypothetical protein